MIKKDNWLHLVLIFIGPVFAVALIEGVIGGISTGAWEGIFAGFAFLGVSLILQTIVAVLLLAPIFILGKKVNWGPMDVAGAFLPWAIWAFLILLPLKSKSFSNVLIEAVAVGGAAPVGALCRVVFNSTFSERNAVRTSLAVGGVIAFCIYVVFPPLGE